MGEILQQQVHIIVIIDVVTSYIARAIRSNHRLLYQFVGQTFFNRKSTVDV